MVVLLLRLLFTDFAPLDSFWKWLNHPATEQRTQGVTDQRAARLLREAQRYLQAGHYAEAARAFAAVEKLDPADPVADLGRRKAELLARSADSEYDPEVIRQRLAALLAEAPDDPHLLTLRGNLRKRGGDPQGARSAYERALEVDPDFAEAAYGLGTLALGEWQPDDATKLFGRALAQAPDEIRYRAALAQSLALGGDYATAAERYREAVSLDPEDLLVRAEHTLVLLHLDRLAEATEAAAALQALCAEEATAALKKNRGVWLFPAPDHRTYALQTLAEKRLFTRALSASLALLGGREAATKRLAALADAPRERGTPLYIVLLELSLYAAEHPHRQSRVDRILPLLATAIPHRESIDAP